MKPDGHIIRTAAMPFLLIVSVFLSAGCAHRSPFTEEPYAVSVGGEKEFILTIDLDRAGVLTDSLMLLIPGGENTAALADKVSRLTLSAVLPEMQEDGTYTETKPGFYGAAEGDISMPLINALLGFVDGWKKRPLKTSSAWENLESGLKVSIPENGLALFSTFELEDAYEKTYVSREMYIPLDIAERLNNGIIGLYVEKPRYLFSFLEDVIPYSLLVSIDSIWMTIDSFPATGESEGEFESDTAAVNESDDVIYALYGVITTTQKSATTVISLTLKKKYLEKIRAMESKPENWMESILVDSSQNIIINNMEMKNEELVQLLRNMTQTMIQE